MSLWDMNDCRCVEAIKLQQIHTDIRAYTLTGSEIPRLFCCGRYAEILVMDMVSLSVLFTLNSRVDPDWIAAVDIIHPVKGNDDVVVALSTTGCMKVWRVDEQEALSKGRVLFEGESKPIKCYHAVRLACCMYNQRTLLIVCPLAWYVYDASDFSQLCLQEAYSGERWTGGCFLSVDQLIGWTNTGKVYAYRIPPRAVPGSKTFHAVAPEPPTCVAVLHATVGPNLVHPPVTDYFLLTRDSLQKHLVQCDASGSVYRWKLHELQELSSVPSDERDSQCEQRHPVLIPPAYSTSLQASWDQLDPPPVGLLDGLDLPVDSSASAITASTFLPIQGQLACGRSDGSIVIISVIRCVMAQMLWSGGGGRSRHVVSLSTGGISVASVSHRSPQHPTNHQMPSKQQRGILTLEGHQGRVTALLYPHNVHTRYDVAHLVSGGVDFSVCLWDLYSGSLLHRFSVHAGEITQLQVPPETCNQRVLQCVCSTGSDHAVALLHLRDRKCVMLGSRHLFPITSIKWRPLDDFLVVGCLDGSVYVWQMETCHLDRVVQGMMADDILNACDEHASGSAAGAGAVGDKISNPAVHLLRGLRHRNMAAVRHAAQRGLVQLHHTLEAHNQRLNDPTLRFRAHPLVIQGLRSNLNDNNANSGVIAASGSGPSSGPSIGYGQQQDSHVFFFDIEALIVQLLTEEYSQMTPGTLESHGLISQTEYDKYYNLASSPDANKKFAGFIAKVKDTAESAASKIQATAQATAESVGIKSSAAATTEIKSDKDALASTKPGGFMFAETNQMMQVAQLLLSQLHAWGLDTSLDQVCQAKLGLLTPIRPAHFGLLSRNGHMALFLPTHMYKLYPANMLLQKQQQTAPLKTKPVVSLADVGHETLLEEERARLFSAYGHWGLAKALTTNHLLSLVALSNTLMSMNSATFIDEQEKRRKLSRKLSRSDSRVASGVNETLSREAQEAAANQQVLIKDGWSRLAAHHCVLLPELIHNDQYKRPQLEMLARRWQDRCLEVREAAQALLLAELQSIGADGRRRVVDSWSLFLPNYGEQQPLLVSMMTGQLSGGAATTLSSGAVGSIGHPQGYHHQHQHQQQTSGSGNLATSANTVGSAVNATDSHNGTGAASSSTGGASNTGEDSDDDEFAEDKLKLLSAVTEAKRKQSTAVVLLAVIGATYGSSELEQQRKSVGNAASGTGGFGPAGNTAVTNTIAGQASSGTPLPSTGTANTTHNTGGNRGADISLTRHTAQALSYLLLSPASSQLPAHTSLRRAAIDLIGRGFTVWENHLDVTRVLIGLLELCCNSDRLVPTMTYGLPLTPPADSCRSARHSLSLIASARPPAFITTLAREVHRYNALAQNAQTLPTTLSQTVLHRAKPEILRVVELLIERAQQDVHDLLVEVMDIVLHCLDSGQLKLRGLPDLFPPICRFHNVSHCGATRRIAVGSRNGTIALYELKASKCQIISAHSTSVTACAFSPEGKYLASFATGDAKLSFWQTATGLFGLGNAQTKCVRSCSAPTVAAEVARAAGPLRLARLVWPTNRLVVLMFADGTEHKFSL